ncbi:MAG: hypothetical protein HPY69_19495 [Armatimonadetes bacterium]|nr:hypothetical protein [Armatimonadota bacterium]
MIKRVPSGKIALGAVVMTAILAGALGLLLHGTVSAQDEEANPLKDLLEKTGLKTRALDDESWIVPFDAQDGGTIDVYVTYNNEKKKFAMIFATVVDKDDKFEFGREVLVECMKLNNDYPACKFCLDYDHGDIDCQSEVLISTLTAESLDMHINLVAALADEQAESLRALVK